MPSVDVPPPPAPTATTLARRKLALAAVAVVIVFAGVTLALTWQLRARMVESLGARDAEVLSSVAQLRVAAIRNDLATAPTQSRETLLLASLLEVAELRGVLGMRLYTMDGSITSAVPIAFIGFTATADEVRANATGRPRADFITHTRPGDWFGGMENEGTPRPFLRVRVPLQDNSPDPLGMLEFLLDGTSLAAQRADLDRQLWRQAGLVFAIGTLIAGLISLWALRNLNRSARLLADRQERLLAVNRELSLAIKTSAIGTITAHLLHDLKNPLAGLESFVRAGAAGGAAAPDSDEWETAAASARHMRRLVAEVIDTLRSVELGDAIDWNAAELAAALLERHRSHAARRGVDLRCEASAELPLVGRHAQIALLILANLVRNALDATPAGGAVTVTAAREADHTVWRVRDAGPGLPPHVRASLFQPCTSTKPDGNGIGLAISAQLATHVAALLELEHTGPDGTTFRLRLPATSPTPSTPA